VYCSIVFRTHGWSLWFWLIQVCFRFCHWVERCCCMFAVKLCTLPFKLLFVSRWTLLLYVCSQVMHLAIQAFVCLAMNVVVLCLQSSYTPCHSSFCLSRDDAPASTRHHGEGCVCLGDGLPLLRPHLPPLLWLRWIHTRHNRVSRLAFHPWPISLI